MIPAISSGMPDPLGDVDRLGGSLVRVDPSEEQEVAAVTGAEIELADIDPVVDRRRVVEPLVPVGVADCDVVADVVVALVDGHDPLRRETVNRRDDRRVHEAAEAERQEIEAVVDEVELVGSFECSRDVQRLPDLRVHRRILRVSRSARSRRAERAVIESAVANSVTSKPRATSPSVRSDANCSHGP